MDSDADRSAYPWNCFDPVMFSPAGPWATAPLDSLLSAFQNTRLKCRRPPLRWPALGLILPVLQAIHDHLIRDDTSDRLRVAIGVFRTFPVFRRAINGDDRDILPNGTRRFVRLDIVASYPVSAAAKAECKKEHESDPGALERVRKSSGLTEQSLAKLMSNAVLGACRCAALDVLLPSAVAAHADATAIAESFDLFASLAYPPAPADKQALLHWTEDFSPGVVSGRLSLSDARASVISRSEAALRMIGHAGEMTRPSVRGVLIEIDPHTEEAIVFPKQIAGVAPGVAREKMLDVLDALEPGWPGAGLSGLAPHAESWPPDSGWHFRAGEAAFNFVVFDCRGKPHRLLDFLRTQRGPATRNEIRDGVWPGEIIGDETVRQCVTTVRRLLRKAFGLRKGNPVPCVDREAWRLREELLRAPPK